MLLIYNFKFGFKIILIHLAQAQADLTQSEVNLTQYSTDLTISEANLIQTQADLALCENDLADCVSNQPIPEEGSGPTCFDGFDNDGNGLTDCADPGCVKKKQCK